MDFSSHEFNYDLNPHGVRVSNPPEGLLYGFHNITMVLMNLDGDKVR